MTRFYQNPLGKRAGLSWPLPKAEALAESKAWLRRAGPEEVGEALAASPVARSFAARRSAEVLSPVRRPHVFGRLHPHRVPGLSEQRSSNMSASICPAIQSAYRQSGMSVISLPGIVRIV